MKYSIRGWMSPDVEHEVVSTINQYTLWRLVTDSYQDESNYLLFHFEVWLNDEQSKDNLFSDLTNLVDVYTGKVDWHICHHDEEIRQSCVISQVYSR